MLVSIVSDLEVTHMVRNFCAAEGIPLEQVVLGGGASLMLRGMRETTNDINLWVEQSHFRRLCEQNAVINHPMTDTVVHPKDHPYFWIREWNPYFEAEEVQGIQCFDVLTMTIHKRGGMIRVERPLAKRQQDRKDLLLLDAWSAEKNKVRA